ncbi:MAG: TonB-dependent receptor [Algicola sp.]|nr:TonB-dependent receptor [Algicola sp.]
MKRQTVIALLLSATLPGVALADEETGDDDVGDMSLDNLFKLEVIQVTSRKRVENMQDVPASVTAIQGDKLDVYGSGGMDIRFLSGKIPSLSIESSFGRTFPRFYVRGLGNTDFDLNGSQPVSLVFDEVVLENPILKGFPVFDVARIEVLRGPQGTLFGRNTPAGLVKFDSAKPSQEFEGYANLSYGTQSSIDFDAAVSGSVSDNVSARLSVMRQEKDNWIDNLAPGFVQDNVLGGHDETAARLQFLFEGNDMTALLNYHMRSMDASPIPFRANIIKPGTNDFADGYDSKKIYQDAASRAMQSVDSKGASLKLEYAYDKYTITAITGFESVEILSGADIDGGHGAAFLPPEVPMGPGVIFFPAESSDGIPDHSQWSQELRLSTNELGKLDYQLGVFYFEEELTIDSFSFNTLAGGALDGVAQQQQETVAWAVFGTIDYDMSDQWKVTTGLRYSKDKKDFFAQRTLSPFGAPNISGEAHPSDSHVSWDVSATYEIDKDTNFYTRIADGFRAPSVQGRILFGDEVTVADSETILSFEAGIKADMLDGRARVNTSVFYYTMDNQQITAVGGDSNFNRLVNVNQTVGYGFEVDAELAATPDLLLTANLSYNNTQLNDETLSIPVCAQCTVTNTLNADGRAMLDGNSLPHAPQWIANITARYSTQIGEGELYVYTDWSYRSSIDFFLYKSVEFEGKSLLEGGLRVGYSWSTDDHEYDVALFIRNITDEENIIGGIDFNNLTGIVNEGRFVGAEFKVNFF